jgi:outer membrane protein OmpA-like peptidoglycan-associated protein
MLGWLAVNSESGRIERDLERRSAAALAGGGHDWASVAFSGRDGLLVGTPHRTGQRDEAIALVGGVWGVRIVVARDRANVDPASPGATPAIEDIPRLPLRDLAPVDLPVAASEQPQPRIEANPVATAGRPGEVVPSHGPSDVVVASQEQRIAEVSDAQPDLSEVVQAHEVAPGGEAAAQEAATNDVEIATSNPQGSISVMPESKESAAVIKNESAQSETTSIPAADEASDPAVAAKLKDTAPPAERKEVEEAPPAPPATQEQAISIPAADPATVAAEVAKVQDTPLPSKDVAEAKPSSRPQEVISISAADPASDNTVVAKVDEPPPPPERKDTEEARLTPPVAQDEAISIPAADPAADPALVGKVDASPPSEPAAAVPELPLAKPQQPPQSPPLPAPKTDSAAVVPPIPEAKAEGLSRPSVPAKGDQTESLDPGHRFDTAALPPGNIAPAGGCTGDVQAAARQVEVHFARGRAHLDGAGKSAVDRLVGALNACPGAALSVAGHADASGRARRNLTLSKRRARGVTAYLIDKGIDASRLAAVGYGEARPVAPNNTQANRAKNRRIEVVITAYRAPPPPMPVRKQDAHNGLSRR